MRKALWRPVLAVCCVLALALAQPACAGRLEHTVYVAGNEALYPLEYVQHGQWRGVFPQLLERIGQECGLEFVYLPPQSGTSQRQRAQNMQAELLSCLVLDGGEAEIGLRCTPAVARLIGEDGGEQAVCFALTPLMQEETAQRFLDALERCAGETLLLTERDLRRPIPAWAIAAGVLCVLAVAVAAVLIWRRCRVEQQERRVVDEETLLENLDALPSLARTLWYLAVMRVEAGAEAARLKPFIGRDSMPAVLRCGDAALLFSALNKEEAVGRVLGAVEAAGASFAALVPLSLTDMVADDLLHCTSLAMHMACGRGERVLLCDSLLLRQISDKELLRRQLSTAIHTGEFELYVQPIVRAHDGKIVSAEALARWDHPVLGFLMPGRFIELIYELEMEREFDRTQLERVCGEIAAGDGDGLKGIKLHCNVSRRTLSEPEFVDWLLDLFQREQIDKHALVVELTEEELGDREEIYRNLRRLHAAGVALALDDYGSKGAGVQDVRQGIFDVVKLDASLLRQAGTEQGMKTLCEAIENSHAVGASIVCEGVETQEQAEMLDGIGCDMCQGFWFYRPMPVAVTRRVIAEQAGQTLRSGPEGTA